MSAWSTLAASTWPSERSGGGGAHEGRTARQQRPYFGYFGYFRHSGGSSACVPGARGAEAERCPVAGADGAGGVGGGDRRGVRVHGAFGCDRLTTAAVDPHDTGGDQALVLVRGEGVRDVGTPAVRGERMRVSRRG